MDIKEKSSKGLIREFEIKIKRDNINILVDKKLSDLSGKANLPGFRPGKVPISILKSRFGNQILGEVVNDSMNDASKKIIEDNKINAVTQPKLEITSFEDGKDLLASFSVEIMPIFKTPDLTSMKIIKPTVKVTEKDVNDAIDRIIKENPKTDLVKEDRSVKNGDTVVIDFEGKIENKPFEGGTSKGYFLKIGSQTFIPGFEEKLIGLKKGEEKKIDLNFPKDYQSKNLSGKEVQFDVKINEIRIETKTVINDEFAKSLGVENLDNLRNSIKTQISNQHELTSKLKSKREILDKLADSVEFDLPKSLEVDEYNNVCSAMNINLKKDEGDKKDKPFDTGMTEEEKKDARAIASRRVRLGLVLSEIGRQNNIKVEEEDKKNAMMREVQKYPGREKEILDYFKNNPDAQNQFAGPVFEDKIIDFIMELAKVENRDVSVEELYKEEPSDLKIEAKKARNSKKKVSHKKVNKKKENKS